ncbi:signal peptide peptidase SppA [Helicobacter sp. MIT 14-3879]|nr:signal peptide peptidase SppA [Helicobacter sp. MIT 14-3879]
MKKFFNIFILTPIKFIQTYFKTCLFIFLVLILIELTVMSNKQKLDVNLATLYLEGPIFRSDLFQAQIESLKKFPNIKGILLVIDSPGGTLAASIEIADMIKELNEKIPVIAYVQGTMASGSYYAGMYSSYIIANRGSMIGSIGVIFNGFNIEELMNKVGIKSQSLKAGEFKEAGTMSRKWSENEKSYLQNVINQQYNMFVNDVSIVRKLDRNNYKDFAEGKIFNSYNALQLGLIDLVGTQKQAINMLQELSKVKNPVWVKPDVIDSYIKKLTSQAISEVFAHLNNIQ